MEFVLVQGRWLATWAGIGDVEMGMTRQGFDLELTKYNGRRLRAAFYVAGIEHSPTSAERDSGRCTKYGAACEGRG